MGRLRVGRHAAADDPVDVDPPVEPGPFLLARLARGGLDAFVQIREADAIDDALVLHAAGEDDRAGPAHPGDPLEQLPLRVGRHPVHHVTEREVGPLPRRRVGEHPLQRLAVETHLRRRHERPPMALRPQVGRHRFGMIVVELSGQADPDEPVRLQIGLRQPFECAVTTSIMVAARFARRLRCRCSKLTPTPRRNSGVLTSVRIGHERLIDVKTGDRRARRRRAEAVARSEGNPRRAPPCAEATAGRCRPVPPRTGCAGSGGDSRPVAPHPWPASPHQRRKSPLRVAVPAAAEQLIELGVGLHPSGRGDLEGGQRQVVPIGVDGVDPRRVGGQEPCHTAAGPAHRQHSRTGVQAQDAVVDLRVLVEEGEGEDVLEGRGERAIRDPLKSPASALMALRTMPVSSSPNRVIHSLISAPDHSQWRGE